MTHDITLTSASTEMGFTLSSIWGSVVAKLLALLEYYLSRAEGVGDMDQTVLCPCLYSSYPYMSAFRSHLFLTTHQITYMFLLEVMPRAVCQAVSQAGLPIFNIR